MPTVQIVTSMDCEKLPRNRRICCNLDEVSPVIFFLLAERFRARASLNMWAKAKGMTAASVPIRVRVSNPPPLASSTNDHCSIIAVNTPPVQTHPELHDPVCVLQPPTQRPAPRGYSRCDDGMCRLPTKEMHWPAIELEAGRVSVLLLDLH